MSLGTGIFLSSIILAIVILYGITKDRWGWRRILKRIALSIFGFVALLAAIFGGYYFWEQRKITHERQTEYAGLRLGMSPDEAMYVKGYPPKVLEDPPKDAARGNFFDDIPLIKETLNLPKGKRVQDYREWMYDNGRRSTIKVTFDPKVPVIKAIQCFSEDTYECPSLLGLSDGSSETAVVAKLGVGSSRIQGLNKYLSYPEIGVHFVLSKEKVYILSIAEQKYRPE